MKVKMKIKMIKCDICGKDITHEDIKYKFKQYVNSYVNSYVNYEDFEFQKWSRLDMCEDCYKRFIEFINNERSSVK